MNRVHFTADDFVMDEYFQRWIFTPDDETDLYWRNFLNENPHQRKAIDEATEFLHIFSIDKNDVLQSRVANIKKRVNQVIDQGEASPDISALPVVNHVVAEERDAQPANRKWWYAVAAGVTALVATGALLWTVVFPSTQQYATDRGHRSIITLEDGTKVWLNADSKLRAPKSFANAPLREVMLEGEAFFDVTPNPKQPFIVHAADINVKVLGTSFNVSAYNNQKNIETTLVEGKVTIETKDAKTVTLMPNQRAIYQKKSKDIQLIDQTNTETVTGWKDGNLNFDNVPLEEMIAALERWYNITIHVPANARLSCRFSAKVETKTLEQVLELFEASDGITYQIKGKEVYIDGFMCTE